MGAHSKNWLGSNFRLEIDGVSAGAFKNVEGLDSETEVVESKMPGPTHWGNITLKRGGFDATDPLGHKVSPATAMHKVNPNPAMHKVNPNPAMHKVTPNPAMHKVAPNPAMHKVNPGGAMSMHSGARVVLHGFVLDQRNKTLQHWVDPGAPQKATPRGEIVMLDLAGRPVRRWQFYEAWPCKWYVPELDTDSSASSSSEGGTSVELVIGKLVKL